MFKKRWKLMEAGYPLDPICQGVTCQVTQLKYACQMAALLASFMQGKTCKAKRCWSVPQTHGHVGYTVTQCELNATQLYQTLHHFFPELIMLIKEFQGVGICLGTSTWPWQWNFSFRKPLRMLRLRYTSVLICRKRVL